MKEGIQLKYSVKLKKTLKIWFLGIVVLLGIGRAGFGQQVSYTNQQWFQYYNKLEFNSHWLLLSDAGFRFRDRFQQKSQYLIRAAAGYKLNSKVRFSAGMAHLGFYGIHKLRMMEYRPHQQFSIFHESNRSRFKHRFRLEERYFETIKTEYLGKVSRFNWRWRYRFLWHYLLNPNTSKTIRFWSVIGNEILLNAGTGIGHRVFDQNRFLLGASAKFSAGWVISLTYNYQWRSSVIPDNYIQDSIFWFGIKQTLKVNKD